MNTTRFAPRWGHVPYVAIALSVFVAVAAVLPVAVAIVTGVGSSSKSAFASAPPGTYVVGVVPSETAATIVAAPTDDPAARREIAKIDHLPGYIPSGAVSPDGRAVALVVADGGTLAQPSASLVVVTLETGKVERVAHDVEPLQTPLWAPDGRVVFKRLLNPDAPRVAFYAVDTDGDGEAELGGTEGVADAYAVGFDSDGRFLVVVIDARGSTLVRDWVELRQLSDQITRDWRLSPDGTMIAFIETDLSDGLHYRARIVALDPAEDAAGVQAQALADGGQQLGVAWGPTGATFGNEPGGATREAFSAQSVAKGFDVPLSYSPDGQLLAVQHWDGVSFAEAGRVQLQLLQGAERTPLEGIARVYGWAER